ncbi:MAG TPA: hypothetical protein VIH99_01415, partial [Bdellovibrionota bacterium]
LLRHAEGVDRCVRGVADRFQIRVYRLQNVGNHLHLGVQARTRRDFQNFLRVLPQAIVFFVTKTRKGFAVGRFWDGLACSRVVEWGRDWANLSIYFEKNYFEARGMPRDVVDFWFAQKPED